MSTRIFGDRFRIEEQSGHGGMGTIYRALDVHSGHTVALKVLHESQGRSAERFNQEAALLAELQHPAIVRYIDHGVTTRGEHFIAMEWLDGETLEDRVMKGPLSVLESAKLGRRVLEGLAVAHRKGIVHRDIKPSNLFLPDGQLAQVKILDFGIARRVFDNRRLTMTGSTLGTPMYMSPEQARGAANLDARSDMFSLGAVLFECMTGKPPFTGDTPVAVLAKICLENLDVRARCQEAPAPFVDLLIRMLAKDPDRRPQQADAFAEDFAQVVQTLISLGFDDPGAQKYFSRRTPTPVLMTGEQRVLSAIIVSRPREVTVLSANGADSEDLSTRTWDIPGAFGQAIQGDGFDDAGFFAVEDAVKPYDARVDRFLGGAMLVTMVGRGTPTDQAAQAARCALKLKTVIPRAVFAVSTGRAVVGDKLPIGEVVDWAARLVEGEKSGTVCLDDKTAGLLEARFQVGGGDKKQLLFEKGVKEAPRTVLGKEMPCIGRDRELGMLEALFDECVGEPVARVVVVTSPAGGGKSRVRHEFLERIQNRGEPFELLISRGDSLRAGAPFGLLGPALRSAAGITGGERPTIRQKRLFAHVARYVSPEAQRRVAAFLGEMAGVSFPDDDLPALRAARQDPRVMADQMLAAWLDWLEAECAARPVVLVLEDLQWGDVPSVQFVDAALRTLRERPLMILALGRSEIDEKFPSLWHERDPQRIGLPPLTSKACQKLAKHVLGMLTSEKAAWIVERADGNPFYLEELLRAVAAGADLRKTGAVPDTVLGMVQARFDSLGPDAKRVLRAAAIYGQTFRTDGLRAIIGDADKSLTQWLDILSTREVIFPRQAGDIGEFVFRHALLRDAAYEMLTSSDCVAGHRLAGQFLENAGEREAIVLVEHFDRGAEPARAAHWCRFAAAQALDANDLAATIERVDRGVRLGAEGETLGAMRVTEAQARFWRGEYTRAEHGAREATGLTTGALRLQATSELMAALGQQAHFHEVEMLLAATRTPSTTGEVERARLGCLLRAANYLLPGGRYESVEGLLRELEPRSQELPPAQLARLYDIKAKIAIYRGKQATAAAGFQTAIQLLEHVGDVRAATEMLVNVATVVGDLGVLEDAEQYLATALATAERLDLKILTVCVFMNLALVRANLGRLNEARADGERARALAGDQGDSRIAGGSELYLSTVSFLAHDYAASEMYARAAMNTLREVPTVYPVAVAALSRALFAQARFAEALECAENAHRLLDSLGAVEDGESLIRLMLAECRAAVGQISSARQTIQRAYERVLERAAAIEKPEWREAFLTRLPDHARTIELARQYGIGLAVS